MSNRTATIILALALYSGGANAMEWEQLWLNQNQSGVRMMEQQQFSDAAKTFNNDQWKAAAYYRAGEYEQAIQAWEQFDSVDAHYNRGNALAKSGDFEKAIEAYDTALRLQPEHEDAKYNRDLLKQMMQSSDSDSQQSQDQEQEQNHEQNQQQSQDQRQSDQNSNPSESQQQSSQNQNDSEDEQQQSSQSHQEQQQDAEEQQSQQQSETQQAQQQNSEQQQAELEQSQDQEQTPTEQQVATEQWLRRIQDDPGGLLRRKFRYQYSRRQRSGETQGQTW